MSSKKKKYNARFPPARIKKIMQINEDVGKVAAAVPVIVSRALELFLTSLIMQSAEVAVSRSSKTLSSSHIKLTVGSRSRYKFLQALVSSIPDHLVDEDGNCSRDHGTRDEHLPARKMPQRQQHPKQAIYSEEDDDRSRNEHSKVPEIAMSDSGEESDDERPPCLKICAEECLSQNKNCPLSPPSPLTSATAESGGRCPALKAPSSSLPPGQPIPDAGSARRSSFHPSVLLTSPPFTMIPAAMPHYQTVPGLEYCGYRNLTQTIPFTSTEIPGLVGGHPLNSSTETGIHYPVMTSVSEQPCPYLPMPPSPPVFAGVAVSEVSIPIDYPLNLSMNSRSSHQGKTHADDDYDS